MYRRKDLIMCSCTPQRVHGAAESYMRGGQSNAERDEARKGPSSDHRHDALPRRSTSQRRTCAETQKIVYQPSWPGTRPWKLLSTSRATRPVSGSAKKSISVHPRIRVPPTRFDVHDASSLPPMTSMSHRATREFTPSTPKPILGQPNPRAIAGGSASGKFPAEKNVIDSVGVEFSSFGEGGRRRWVERDVFSGMERKEGMWYLP